MAPEKIDALLNTVLTKIVYPLQVIACCVPWGGGQVLVSRLIVMWETP
jgi:hypothetical protein